MTAAIYVEITETRGSAPRDAGTAMKVTPTRIEGTIGGGALEYEAIAHARRLLVSNTGDESRTFPLGPTLGQCCGGSVTLHFTRDHRQIDQPEFHMHGRPRQTARPVPLWVWGAGHVGRAVVAACPPAAFDITWIDSHADRFPKRHHKNIPKVPAADMPLLAMRAPENAHHLIFTYSHDIDLALCAALLRRQAGSIGLIGSDTKWRRFSNRLSVMGLNPEQITCPIGDKSLGKSPHQIAHGVVQSLLAASHTEVHA